MNSHKSTVFFADMSHCDLQLVCSSLWRGNGQFLDEKCPAMIERSDPKCLAILAFVVDFTKHFTKSAFKKRKKKKEKAKKDLSQSKTNTSQFHVLREVMNCFPQEMWACGKVCKSDWSLLCCVRLLKFWIKEKFPKLWVQGCWTSLGLWEK